MLPAASQPPHFYAPSLSAPQLHPPVVSSPALITMATDAIAFTPQAIADWRNCIPGFIQHLEAGFAASKITDQTTMVSKTQLAVTPAIADEVMDLFLNLPSAAPFDELKLRLLARFTPAPEAKFRQLLAGFDSSDRAPSALYRQMKGLNSNFLTDEALFTLWKNKLHVSIQQHLTAHHSTPLEETLQIADALHTLLQQN
jgi:hypothetical protein